MRLGDPVGFSASADEKGRRGAERLRRRRRRRSIDNEMGNIA